MMTLRVGVVGVGRRARSPHLSIIKQLRDRVELTALCSTTPENVQAAAQEYGVNGYTDLREMVDKEQLDICLVAGPHAMHYPVSCYLSRHHIHQLMETPLSPHPLLGQYMIDEANANHIKLEVAENFPYSPSEQLTRAVIRSGAIGDVGRIYRLFNDNKFHGLAAANLRAGGNPVKVHSFGHDYPVHPFVERTKRYDSEPFEFGAVYYDNGALAILMVGNKSPAMGRNKLKGFEVDGSDGVILTSGASTSTDGEEVLVLQDNSIPSDGEMRTISYQRQYEQIEGVKVLQSIWTELPEIGTISWQNPFADRPIPENHVAVAYLWNSIINAVEHDMPLVHMPEDGKKEVEVLHAMKLSAEHNGIGIDLPLVYDESGKEQFAVEFERQHGRHPLDIDGLIADAYAGR